MKSYYELKIEYKAKEMNDRRWVYTEVKRRLAELQSNTQLNESRHQKQNLKPTWSLNASTKSLYSLDPSTAKLGSHGRSISATSM